MRKNDDIASWRLFFRVVELSSVSKAADEANVEPSSISRRISALEASIDTQLLTRTTRTLKLTDAGARAYEHMRLLIEEMDALTSNLSEETQSLTGNIRIGAPVAMGEFILMHWLTAFQVAHPDVRIDLALFNSYNDLIADGIDFALRIGLASDDKVIAKKLGHMPSVMCAAPNYLAAHGTPQQPSDLANHRHVLYSALAERGTMTLTRGDETASIAIASTLKVNNLTAIHQAALDGAGIHLFAPLWQCIDDLNAGRLTRLLPDWHTFNAPVHIVYSPRRHTPKRVLLLMAHIRRAWLETVGLEA